MKQGKNIYYDNALDIPVGKSGDFEIVHETKPAGTKLFTGNMRMAMFGQPTAEVSYPHDTRWHYLKEGGGVWMSDLPCEQYQHDQLLAQARGKVLVGGLGLGYAVAALSKKPRVKEIVVIENSTDVIELVKNSLQTNEKKVTVVCEDLFEYLRTSHEKFSFGFYDIWQSDGETTFHETVVPLRKLSRGKVNHVTCWNENIMRGQLFQGIHGRLLFLSTPDTQLGNDLKNSVNLELLATENKSPYINWAVPYWRWYQEVKPSMQTALDRARRYVTYYGLIPDHQLSSFIELCE